MEKEYYVTLTGSKNNAGDFLIKKRAFSLFDDLRPDRAVIDFNGWEPLSEEKLAVINKAKALILTGGPALQYNMWPKVYSLTPSLNDIRVPICTLGVGWKSPIGNWDSTRSYPLSQETHQLLMKIKGSGLKSSVRDFHTLNALQSYGHDNFLMTGCPALYVKDSIGKAILKSTSFKRVVFSLGVSFLDSKKLENQMKESILKVKEVFAEAEVVVAFHHTISPGKFPEAKFSQKHINGHAKFIDWLRGQRIGYLDVSGSAETMIDAYSNCDFHIGYRVHAHILMSSLGLPSLLLAEDGRGIALRDVIGGMVLDAYNSKSHSLISKVLARLDLKDSYDVSTAIPNEVMNFIKYEKVSSWSRSRIVRKSIDSHFETMNQFFSQLP